MSTATNEATRKGNLRDAWRQTPREIKCLMAGVTAGASVLTAAITIPISCTVCKKKNAKKAKDLFYSQQNQQAQPQQDQQQTQGQPNQQNAQQQSGPQQNQQAQSQQQAQ